MHSDPLGLMELDVSALLLSLPSRRGILRVARYYEKGGTDFRIS